MIKNNLLKMNLQLFAADTGADGGSYEEDEKEDVVDPQNEETDKKDTDINDDSDNESEEQDTPIQTKEQNRAFKEYRQRAENAEKKAKQYEQELNAREQWIKNTFAQYGVTSWEEYQQTMENQIMQQRQQQLQDMGVDPRVIENIIKNDPELIALKKQNETLQKQMQDQEINTRMVSEYNELIKEFGEDFPELKDPDKIPVEVWDKFDKGYSLVDAFYVTQKGKIMEQQKSKTKQATLNNINSKKHLKTEGDGTKDGEDVNIPKEVMEVYKEMGFDKKEAIAYHKKLYK